MQLKGLFDNTNVVYLPYDDNIQDIRISFNSLARYHGLNTKVRTGIFIDSKTQEVQKIARLELIGADHLPSRKNYTISDEKQKRNQEIIKKVSQGVSITELANEYNISRQGVYYIVQGK